MNNPPPPASLRVSVVHEQAANTAGEYVLYWMIGARRASWNFALDRAVDWARHLNKPLLVLEALTCDYRWASDRLHRFVIDGMRDNAVDFAGLGIGYYAYVEPSPHAGRGLLAALSRKAALVVTDRAPVFVMPRLVAAAARRLTVRLEAVDSSGIVPLDAPPPAQVFPTAYAFRRFLQRVLPIHLSHKPRARPIAPRELMPPPAVPPDVLRRWPPADPRLLARGASLARLPIDHSVAPTAAPGGTLAARARLASFVDQQLPRYGESRNHPDNDIGSRLSPYLHFGHISPHEIVGQVLKTDGWSPAKVARTATGAKDGWWGAPGAEAFLDQVITWRELGFNMSARRPDFDRFESLPPWAIATLDKHASDPRPYVYTLDQFAAGATHDALWNAAARQLAVDGTIHNYLRMLWGKKIVEWPRSPREALDVMIELNNRYAVDGRDPNSYSGIFWVLGRYDRPWAPERPIFGTVRYMTSANTARKLHVKEYLRRHGQTQARLDL